MQSTKGSVSNLQSASITRLASTPPQGAVENPSKRAGPSDSRLPYWRKERRFFKRESFHFPACRGVSAVEGVNFTAFFGKLESVATCVLSGYRRACSSLVRGGRVVT